MLFQAILLRYTGRTYCFEEYYQFCLDKKSKTNAEVQNFEQARRIPFRKQCNEFLHFVQLHMQHRKTKQLGGWISKQHDGAIARDLKMYYKNFREFVENISTNIGSTVTNMLGIAGTKAPTRRLLCIAEFQKMIESAMKSASVRDNGRVKWMAYITLCYIEEFVLEPFGAIDETSIREGIYSIEGHEMINRGLAVRDSYQDCLQKIVSYVHHSLPASHLFVLGYDKEKTLY
jgi:hypothetical protein